MALILNSILNAPFDEQRLRAFINGVEIKFDSNFTIKEELSNVGVIDLSDVVKSDLSPIFFQQFSKFTLYYKGKMIFRGITDKTDRGHFDTYQRNKIDSLTIYSWRKWLDYIRVSFTITKMKPIEIMNIPVLKQSLLNNKFKLGDLDFTLPDVDIKGYGIEDAPVSDFLDFICELTNSLWTVEFDQSDNFYKINIINKSVTRPANHVLKDSDLQNPNSEIISSIWENINSEYANTLILESDNFDGDEKTEYLVYNNENEFELNFPIKIIHSIQEYTLLNSNYQIKGIYRTFANNLQKENGVTADFYYNIGSKTLELNTDHFQNTNLVNKKWIIKYKTRQNIRLSFTDFSEIDRIKNNFIDVDGKVIMNKSVDFLKDNEELTRYANNFFSTYSKPHVDLIIRSRSEEPLYKIGDIVDFQVEDKKMQKMFAAGSDVSRFIVKSIEASYETANFEKNEFLIERTYTLSNVFSSVDYLNFFDKRSIDPFLRLIDEGVIKQHSTTNERDSLIFEVID